MKYKYSSPPNLIDSWVDIVRIQAETLDSERCHVAQIHLFVYYHSKEKSSARKK